MRELFEMVESRSLHKLAEALYEALDDRGFWDDEIRMSSSRGGRRTRGSSARSLASYRPRSRPKARRKVSKYQRAFGVCLKQLKKKHPRTPTSKLMKKAHTCARKKKRAGGW